MTLFGENYNSAEFMLGLITRAEHCAPNTLYSKQCTVRFLHLRTVAACLSNH